MNALMTADDFPLTGIPAPKPRVDVRVVKQKEGAVDSWVEHMLRRFFGQKRAMWEGRGKPFLAPDGTMKPGHEFGWSARSVMGKLHEEGDGAAQRSAFDINYAEHYTEDALLVRRAIQGCDHDQWVVGHLHYIVPASVKVKARDAGWAPATYYIHLGAFHTWTRGRLELLDAEVSRQKIAAETALK